VNKQNRLSGSGDVVSKSHNEITPGGTVPYVLAATPAPSCAIMAATSM
jgi:hypothetical protein